VELLAVSRFLAGNGNSNGAQLVRLPVAPLPQGVERRWLGTPLVGGQGGCGSNLLPKCSKGFDMSKRDDLIAKYASDLKEKCGMDADMDLLTKVTIGCGPSIYNADASTVSGSDAAELETVKNNFLIKKLGLSASADLDGAIASVMDTYGQSNRNKYRAVVYYMLTKHFNKEAVYG